MSYILEALRKVERQRRVRAIPDLATVHDPSPARRLWRPAVLGVLLVNAGFLGLLLWYRPWALSMAPPPPLARAPATDVAGAPPAPSEASASATAPPEVGPSPAVAPAPPALTPSPGPGAASSGPGANVGVALPAQQSAATAPDVPAPAAPRVRITAPTSPGDATGAHDTSTPKPTSTPERPGAGPAPSSRPAPAPGDPAPTTRATAPAPPASRVPVKTTPPADLPVPFRDAVSQLRLEALVYADSPADRKIFINSRRYVEGDKLDSGIVVEQIVEEGVVLSYAGHRYVLRHFR